MVLSGTKFKKTVSPARDEESRRHALESRRNGVANHDLGAASWLAAIEAFRIDVALRSHRNVPRSQKMIDRASLPARATAPKDAALPIIRRQCKIWETPAGHARKNPVLRNEPVAKPGRPSRSREKSNPTVLDKTLGTAEGVAALIPWTNRASLTSRSVAV
jgi:hypothetical protein